MPDDDFEVVWSGGELLPETPQELYQLVTNGKRTLLTLGLLRLREGDPAGDRDASVSDKRQLRPAWKKRQSKQKKVSARSLRNRMKFAVLDHNPNYQGRRKLDEATVRRIRAAYTNGEGGYAALGKRFGMSSVAIMQIVNRDTYRDVL